MIQRATSYFSETSGSEEQCRRVRTLYACVGEHESELSFEPNQVITDGKFDKKKKRIISLYFIILFLHLALLRFHTRPIMFVTIRLRKYLPFIGKRIFKKVIISLMLCW